MKPLLRRWTVESTTGGHHLHYLKRGALDCAIDRNLEAISIGSRTRFFVRRSS